MSLLLVGTGAGVIGVAIAPFTFGISAGVGLTSGGLAYLVAIASRVRVPIETPLVISGLGMLGLDVLFSIYKDYDVIFGSYPPGVVILGKGQDLC